MEPTSKLRKVCFHANSQLDSPSTVRRTSESLVVLYATSSPDPAIFTLLSGQNDIMSTPLWIATPVLLWLAILSYFDWKTCQVPQIAWVFLPHLAASTYRVLSGEWALAALASVTILASERGRLPAKWRRAGTTLVAPVIILLIWMGGIPLETISLAMVGFWLVWELHAWGGADTLTAIVLLLLWPERLSEK
jgi:hypothetical protein